MLFTRPSRKYLPRLLLWTSQDEDALRGFVGTPAYFSLLKFIENRAAERQAEGITARDVYKLERMEELENLKAELQLMQEAEPEPVVEREKTRFEDYQP